MHLIVNIDTSDQFKYYSSPISILDVRELLLESYSFIEYTKRHYQLLAKKYFIVCPNVIQPLRIGNVYFSISSEKQFTTTRLFNKHPSINRYKLIAYQTDSTISFILNTPLVYPETYTLYKLHQNTDIR